MGHLFLFLQVFGLISIDIHYYLSYNKLEVGVRLKSCLDKYLKASYH